MSSCSLAYGIPGWRHLPGAAPMRVASAKSFVTGAEFPIPSHAMIDVLAEAIIRILAGKSVLQRT